MSRRELELRGRLGALHDELEESRARVDRLENEFKALAEKKDSSFRVAVVGGVFAVLAAVGGTSTAYLLNGPADPAPVSVSCSEERSRAAAEVRRDGEWVKLPSSSPVEEQCAINDYIGANQARKQRLEKEKEQQEQRNQSQFGDFGEQSQFGDFGGSQSGAW